MGPKGECNFLRHIKAAGADPIGLPSPAVISDQVLLNARPGRQSACARSQNRSMVVAGIGRAISRPMRVVIFKSKSNPEVLAFTQDDSGGRVYGFVMTTLI